MPDFSDLLNQTSGEAVPPTPLPVGDYPCVIKSWQALEAPKDKNYKSIIRLSIVPIAWPDSVDEDDRRHQTKKDGPLETMELSSFILRYDFYDHQMYILDQFLSETLGLTLGAPYNELLPQMVGAQLVATIDQYVNQRTMRMGNQIPLGGLRKSD